MRRSRRVASGTWFLGVVLFVISWPVSGIVPQAGLDFSYVAGLHMAAYEHLRFGTQVVGTYGPLGFLRYPFLYYTWTARLAFLYTGGVHLLLCVTLIWALRRTLPTLLAFFVAWVAVGFITMAPESALVVAIVWLVECLRTGGSPGVRRAFPILAGVVCGLEVLIKVNTGVTIAALAVLVTLVIDWRNWRRLAIFVASFLMAFAAFWFASGQGLSNIGSYVSTDDQVVSGWSTAMQALGPHSQLWGALVVAIAVFFVAWQSTTSERLRVRLAILVIWLGLGFSVFKEGFVGQSAGHEIIFFATALGAVIAFTWRGVPRSTVVWSLILVASISFTVTLVDPGQFLKPVTDASALANQVRTMVSASRSDQVIANARSSMRTAYGLSPTEVGALSGHSVSVVPSEQSMVWAYQLHWKPTPVYQWYYALTPTLDQLNARTLASAAGPQRLLRNLSPPVNARFGPFDSPAAERAMLCHYAPITASASYEVLGRVPDRCGPPRLLKSVTARWQQLVAVPAPRHPNDLVFVRVGGVAPSGLETVRSLLWRSYLRVIGLKAGGGPDQGYSLVPDTTSDGLLMSVPTGADFPGAFSLSPKATQVAIAISTESAARALTYRFYEQPIADFSS